jgi:DNA repair photolyase
MGIGALKERPLRVISASRRVDLVGGYPHLFAEILEAKCPPDQVHTVVIWTKDPRHLLAHRKLRATLGRYGQLFLHLTVTGMGASALEPRVPEPESVLALLPALIEFVGSPERIRIRFDPIVHVRLADGTEICNLKYFAELAPRLRELGLTDVTTSWLSLYPKVKRRLARIGAVALDPGPEVWREEAAWLQRKAEEYGLRVHGCCVPGWPRSRCIDGDLLTRLHPRGEPASTRKAKGQRALCGCTESWDIGWYVKCLLGCRYCYANPVHL